MDEKVGKNNKHDAGIDKTESGGDVNSKKTGENAESLHSGSSWSSLYDYKYKKMNKANKKKGIDGDLPEKRSHTIGEGFSLFPIHTWLFIIYIITVIILAVFGTLLLINGNFANTGYFTFQAIVNNPWPKLEVEDEDHHAMALEFLQLTCWICGFFFWLFALYLVYVIYVYNSLLWAARPWDRQVWNGIRFDANSILGEYPNGVLVYGKVRHESKDKQFNRMNKKQQDEMAKYKRPMVEPVNHA